MEVHIELEKVENSTHVEKSTYKRVYALEIEAVAPDDLDIHTEELAEIVKTYFNIRKTFFIRNSNFFPKTEKNY